MVSLTLEEVDSGLESMPESSKDLTPEKIPQIMDDFEVSSCLIQLDVFILITIETYAVHYFQNEDDETLTERLLGLTEMFPESVRNATYYSIVGCKAGIEGDFHFTYVQFCK